MVLATINFPVWLPPRVINQLVCTASAVVYNTYDDRVDHSCCRAVCVFLVRVEVGGCGSKLCNVAKQDIFTLMRKGSGHKLHITIGINQGIVGRHGWCSVITYSTHFPSISMNDIYYNNIDMYNGHI